MKKPSIALILIGLIVASYPFMEQAFTWYWQTRLLSEWEQPVQTIAVSGKPESLNIIERLGFEGESKEEKLSLSPQGQIIGILTMDSIQVKMPILKGLNETNLKIGIAYLDDTPMFGGEGNTVLAGHRGHSYGRLLNRLNEVKLKDEILVTTKKGVYHYTVFNKVIVKPEETEILGSAKNERILTLVACEPVYRPTHRLIVQARLDE